MAAQRKTTAKARPKGGPVELERRPIVRQTAAAWWDPFSDSAQPHSVTVCPQSGAVRDGDEAVLYEKGAPDGTS